MSVSYVERKHANIASRASFVCGCVVGVSVLSVCLPSILDVCCSQPNNFKRPIAGLFRRKVSACVRRCKAPGNEIADNRKIPGGRMPASNVVLLCLVAHKVHAAILPGFGKFLASSPSSTEPNTTLCLYCVVLSDFPL